MTATVLPRVASIEDNSEPAAHEAYSVGIERRAGATRPVRFEASAQRMDEVVRAFFGGDLLTDFDSVYFFDGNTSGRCRLPSRHRLSDTLAGSVSVRYGDIHGAVSSRHGVELRDLRSEGHFWSARASVEILPTRTGVAILVRGVRQSLESPGGQSTRTTPTSSPSPSPRISRSSA